MVCLTYELIRKKAEHHDEPIESLAELSLHQCNLTSLYAIPTVSTSTDTTTPQLPVDAPSLPLPTTPFAFTPRLSILYLHNNLLDASCLRALRKLKSLTYLNLTLNNLQCLTPDIASLEKLVKLDLTLNFIALKSLSSSLEALQPLQHLKELYLTGNPCYRQLQTASDTEDDDSEVAELAASSRTHTLDSSTRLPPFDTRLYIISRLPQLQSLDGKEITRGEKTESKTIRSAQEWEQHLQRLVDLEAQQEENSRQLERDERKQSEHDEKGNYTPSSSSSSSTAYTPESRIKMYEENLKHEQLKAEEKKRGLPSNTVGEDDVDLWTQAQQKMNQKIDASSLASGVLPSQRNLGKFPFTFNVSNDEQFFLLTLQLPKYLDSSFIDVDLQVTWCQIMVKNKLFVKHWDGEEISIQQSSVQRRVDDGSLVLKLKRANYSKKESADLHARSNGETSESTTNSTGDYDIAVNSASSLVAKERSKQSSSAASPAQTAALPKQGTEKYRELVRDLDRQHQDLIKQLSSKRSEALEAQHQAQRSQSSIAAENGGAEEDDDDGVPPLM